MCFTIRVRIYVKKSLRMVNKLCSNSFQFSTNIVFRRNWKPQCNEYLYLRPLKCLQPHRKRHLYFLLSLFIKSIQIYFDISNKLSWYKNFYLRFNEDFTFLITMFDNKKIISNRCWCQFWKVYHLCYQHIMLICVNKLKAYGDPQLFVYGVVDSSL